MESGEEAGWSPDSGGLSSDSGGRFPDSAGRLPDTWLLETDVCAMQGVGRFAIGLADHVRVVDSPELSEYIKDFSKKFLA